MKNNISWNCRYLQSFVTILSDILQQLLQNIYPCPQQVIVDCFHRAYDPHSSNEESPTMPSPMILVLHRMIRF